MRALKTKLATAGMVAAALFLSACGTSTSGTTGPTPINLKSPTEVSQLCGSNAKQVADTLSQDADAKEASQKRKDLAKWGLDPKSMDEINAAKAAVDTQTKIECGPDGKPAALSAGQLEAAKTCLSADEQKALKPGPDVNDKIVAGCQAIGKKAFDGLYPENKGDVKDNNSYAHYAEELAATKDAQTAQRDTIILTLAKKNNDKGVKSDRPDFSDQILAVFKDVNKDDVKVGTGGSAPVDFNAHKTEKGGSVFLNGADRILRTKEDIAAFLAEDSDQARAAKDYVTKAIKDAGYGDSEVARAMNGLGYIPIQLTGASQILGTTYYQDGKVNILGQWRQSLPGDVYWLFFSEDGKFIPAATLRADCGNMNMTTLRMVRASTPPAPSVAQPVGEETCPMGTELTSTGECKPPAPPAPPVVCTSNCGNTPPPQTPVCTGTTPYGTYPKCFGAKDSTLDSAPQNNAPVGGGMNSDPGKGTYVPPAQMQQPPPTPRQAPAAPAPQPGPVTQPAPGGGTTVVPAPNPNPAGPRPTASPEPAAPAPSEAPTSCAPAPGKTTC